MSIEFKGDRECPNCETMSLVEHGSCKWKCLNCGEIYEDDWLDCDCEDD